MEIFRGQNLIEFSEHFKTEENSKEYLSNIKWGKGFKCVKCNHKASQIKKTFFIPKKLFYFRGLNTFRVCLIIKNIIFLNYCFL